VTAQDFATSVDRLLNQVGHWEQSRWWTHLPPSVVGSALTTKGDRLYVLIQHLADLGADAERRPQRPVPRLTDLVLPDQLRVMADDLLAADPPEATLKLAAEETAAAQSVL
jgi:hypothetical protein